jgi:rSAM/selenodomain-associated transferase 1
MTSNERVEAIRVAVFAKAPVAGDVKTRLVPLLGAEGAAKLHAALVRRALATAVEARMGEVELWCAPDESHPFFARCAAEFGATLRRQEGEDLGARMAHAFERAFDSGRSLVLIGSDCPALQPADLRAAAAALADHDAALAPAEDGGYVLVALARAVPIFERVAWGGPRVMAQTPAHLEAAGVRWKALPTLWDVDRPEDYARLQGADLAADMRP